jgi:hypothetical protein
MVDEPGSTIDYYRCILIDSLDVQRALRLVDTDRSALADCRGVRHWRQGGRCRRWLVRRTLRR